ncbi:LysE family transporter [Staphylococcus pseudoxylosus]|uniref:LysE family transporter n=1 Tax=Staphylococcus pseudoxylosus TaxID=2282419 RepID=UPI00193A8090|nr:LysE family transporter [Staphylococcus pseudoxylosus]MBM2659376.1 LysE family transporter [Staphylococcus pseudoxylosus]
MQQKNKLGMAFIISSFINIVLALLVVFGISTFSQTILIVLTLITMANAIYLLYKAFYILREERT